MATVADTPRIAKRPNWWKIAFFVALLAFELAREWAVIASYDEPSIAVARSVTDGGGLVTAQGVWVRSDGGDRLVPTATSIECWQDRGECVEAGVQVHSGSVFLPDSETFPARFSPDAVEFDNTRPTCARYVTRIDRRLKTALRLREAIGSTARACQGLEARMEMQLADGWAERRDPAEGHFVPLFGLLIAVVALL